jgi:hypothetical protein
VKRRWKILAGLAGAALLFAGLPIAYVELGCRGGGGANGAAAPYRALAGPGRPEARTWLTYPEWHIVYAADALGGWLGSGKAPSGYPYLADARAFWTSYCALNRVADGREGTGAARVMLHTIGVSFTAEMLVKSVYENTLGRLSEAVGGWTSVDDRYAARVQRRYGAFMHETPWYRFPFGEALAGTWALEGGGVRHWERRAALSSEYGVKAGYARLIGGASGATLGADEVRMRIVLRATPEQVRALDARLVPTATRAGGLAVADTPRYAAFTDILLGLADRGVELVEIAGNDDIFVTVLVPAGTPVDAATTMTMALPDGRERRGLSVKVPRLLPLLRSVRAGGGMVEHVYDY